MAKKRYRIIGVGGTFDHFHKGHESFLKGAATFAEAVLVGITHEKLTQHKQYPHLIQPYFKRAQAVHRFFSQQNIPHQIVTLNDPFGPAIDPNIILDALAVTEATVTGADKINSVRPGLGLRELPVHVHSLLKDETGTILSAERIRAGEVSREGVVYGQIFKQDHQLTTIQRDFFQKLQGKLVTEPTNITGQTIAVGDATLEKFIDFGWPLDLAIYDGQIQREPVQKSTVSPTHTLKNPAGVISNELFSWLQNYFQKTYQDPQLLKIDGEEDLATVATVLAAPLNSTIYYGQPEQGMVELIASEKVKAAFYQALTS